MKKLSAVRRAVLALPYLLMALVTPVYNLLDEAIFVKVFGCGCPKIGEPAPAFNANDLRRLVYGILVLIAVVLSLLFARWIRRRLWRVLYLASVAAVNLVLASCICTQFMWC